MGKRERRLSMKWKHENKSSYTRTVQNIIITFCERLPFLVLAFIWRKKISQSIPRAKRIEFIRNSGDSNRFGAILDFSLYSNFPSFPRRHTLFAALLSCAILPQWFFVFSRENATRPNSQSLQGFEKYFRATSAHSDRHHYFGIQPSSNASKIHELLSPSAE